jgi:mono/diheme cytochrome c family protein
LALAAALAAALPGCGSSQSHAPSSARALFTEACGACHSLTGHNDPRRQGGDLLNFHATHEQLLQLASEMPVRHPLTEAQLDAVVRYVRALEAARR